jgi:DNA mismatch repair protein MutS
LEAGSLPASQDVQMTLDALWMQHDAAAAAESRSNLTEEEAAFLAELKELDLNQTTPMEAMLKMYEWKQRLKHK